LSPQQQREFFALLLIGIGFLLLVLLLTSASAGAVGQFVAEGVQGAFGRGAVVVPLLFMVVGGLIIWQERFIDAPISGSNMLGILLLAVVSLAILHPKDLDTYVPPGAGGGFIGLGINTALVGAFGVAGTWTLLALLFLYSVLLTFNITIRQFITSMRVSFMWMWGLIVGGGRRAHDTDDAEADELEPEPVPFANELQKPKRTPRTPDAPRHVTSSSDELQQQLVLTPIAERPTQPGLFGRGRAEEATARPASAVPATTRETLAKAETQQLNAQTPTPPKDPKAAVSPKPPDDDVAAIEIDTPRQAWPLPSLAMLDDFTEGEVDDNEKRSKARVIEDTLASFKIEAQVVGMSPGPAVTQYQLQPAVGVKVSRIMSLEKDLALALAAPSIRIEAPIPGTSYIGIEIPNIAISTVAMKEVVDTDEFALHKGKLKLALGKDVSGTPVITDLTRAPHLLIAGSTGSGKSAALNSIVVTLLLKHTPDDLKFIMVDPKMVELIVYNHIPHLLAPVVTELERVVSLLKWAVREMERRYKLLAQKGFRNIESFNKEARRRADLEPLPYIVIIVDELADLMMMAPDEVETLICRLAQMARAIGIHLILATQRPSVDVVTGLIKANFPTRMAFAVTQQIDSRVILDTSGAEQLLGRGDMLYLASDAPKPIRVQGTWVSEHEVEQIVRFWRATRPPQEQTPPSGPKPVPLRPATSEEDGKIVGATPVPKSVTKVLPTNVVGNTSNALRPSEPDAGASGDGEAVEPIITVSPLPSSSAGTLSDEEQDELLPQAIKLVRQHERASASLLQRRLRIGYSKAAQLIDLLEQKGVLGPAEGGRSHEVLNDDHRPITNDRDHGDEPRPFSFDD
jgi:DNA segregation ATPase FtsK/SpoIIIE, S-DNA-T family